MSSSGFYLRFYLQNIFYKIRQHTPFLFIYLFFVFTIYCDLKTLLSGWYFFFIHINVIKCL
jgi:hypothetical protein